MRVGKPIRRVKRVPVSPPAPTPPEDSLPEKQPIPRSPACGSPDELAAFQGFPPVARQRRAAVVHDECHRLA